MINGSFFIEHSEVIGLWIIYSTIMLILYFFLDHFTSTILARIKRARRIKLREIQANDKLYKLANKARVSSQIRAIMNAQL